MDKANDQVPVDTPDQSAPKLPDRNFFEDGVMETWAEQSGLLKPETSPVPATPTKRDEPSEDGPPTAKEIASIPADAQGRKPIDVLKVKGKLIPIYDQGEYRTLAQKGLHFTREHQKTVDKEKAVSAKEAEISKREAGLNQMLPMMEKLVSLIESGKTPGRRAAEPTRIEEPGQTPEEDDLNLTEEELSELPPALRKVARLAILDRQEKAKQRQAEDLERTKSQIDKFGETVGAAIDEARTEFPFGEDVTDEESGDNVTRNLYAGLLSFNVNKEIRSGRKMEEVNLPEMIRLTARTLNKFVGRVGGNGQGSVSVDSLRKSNPALVQEIGQAAVADYLRNAGEAPISLKAGGATPESRVESRSASPKPGKFASLDEALAAGLSDPAIEAALNQIGKSANNL